ncbi:MAG: GNAT family N-acetyltransferase [Thermodesulfobacteriota bacterium]
MAYPFSDDILNDLKRYVNHGGQHLLWPSVFVLPGWMEAWWRIFGSEAEMMIRTLREEERIIGIAPLMMKDGQALFIGDTEVCDYLDFIVSPGSETVFYQRLLDDLATNNIKHLDLKHLRPESTVLTHLARVAENRRYPVNLSQDALSLELDLPGDWEAYLKSLGGKERHEVRRKLRRLTEKGIVEYRFIDRQAELPEMMALFFKMFVESREDKADFLNEKMKSFFLLVSEAMAESGLLKMGLLQVDKNPVSAIMCFDYKDGIYLYNSGYDPAYMPLSAGLICKLLAIKNSIELGKKRFDFLKGSELYKYRLGGKEVPLYRCQITIT